MLRELLKGEFAASSHIYARATKRPIWPEVVGVKAALVPL
jgi:hypothetical protein